MFMFRAFALLSMAVCGLAFCNMPLRGWFIQESETNANRDHTIQGVVVTSDGNAAVGAKVALCIGKSRGVFGEFDVHITQTDADGRFQFEDQVHQERYWSITVYQPGWALGGYSQTTPGPVSRPSADIEIELPPAKEFPFQLLNPDGQPIDVATIRVSSVYPGRFQSFLNAVESETKSETERDSFYPEIYLEKEQASGQFTIPFLTAQDRINLEIQTGQFGVQKFYIGEPDETHSLQLQPLCQLQGALVDEDQIGSFHGMRLRVASYPDNSASTDSGLVKASSELLIDVAQDGSFSCDRLTAGKLVLDGLRTPRDHWYLADRIANKSANQPELGPGKPLQIKARIKKTILVKGIVTGDDGSPIEGIKLSIGGFVTTDAQGQFSVYCPPGSVFCSFLNVPDPWIKPAGVGTYLSVPQGVTEYTSPAIQLAKAAPVSGTVVDEQGRPVPGAAVFATWQASVGDNVYTDAHDWATSDEQGKFVLSKAYGAAPVTIYAATENRAQARAVVLKPGAERNIRLVLSKDQVMCLRGKLVTKTGMPIANAKISVWAKEDRSAQQLRFDGGGLITNELGEFKTANTLLRQKDHFLVIRAKGYTGVQTETFTSPSKGDLEIEPLVLDAVHSVSGKVVDSDGKPVSSATVWSFTDKIDSFSGPHQRTSVQTDRTGDSIYPTSLLAAGFSLWITPNIVLQAPSCQKTDRL